MDFEFDEDQTEIQGLAKRIVADHSSPEHLTEIEAEHGGVDRPLLRALGEAGLLGLALQEDAGGAGLTFVDACLVLEEVGRHAAAAPVLENILSALAIDAFADETLRREWLPALSGGERVVAPALVDGSRDPRRPATTATRLPDGGYRLDGTKVCVTTGMAADALLVSATIAGGASTGVFLVPTDAHGITRDGQMTTTHRPTALVTLSGVEVPSGALIGGDSGRAGEVAEWMIERITAAMCVMAVGACDAATRLTAEYVKERQQFGRALATFQAVGQRAADAFVDTMAIRLTAWQAAWRLSAGLPAADQVAIAKFWAAEGGQRVVHAAQHLHGGVGVDRTYPLHRYFLLSKQLELMLGGSSAQLAALGKRIAESTTAA